MKKIILFILFVFTGISNILNAQNSNFIIVGRVSSKDSLYIQKDLLYTGWSLQGDSIDIDLNKDNISDFRLLSWSDPGVGAEDFHSSLESINNNAFFCNYYRGIGCFPYLVRRLNFGDTINKKLSWTDSSEYLIYYNYFPPGPGSSWGEWDNNSGYLGLMIIVNNDTIYGWVHAYVQNYGQDVQIDSCVFQCNKFKPYTIINDLSIYPNPASDNLTIEIEDFRFTNLDLRISDIVGNLVLEKTLYNKLSNINVSNLAKGMYFVKLKTENGVESRKFVKL